MQDGKSWGRRIAMIVVVGGALGLVYNGAAQMSRPPRGIPWLAARTSVADLDTLAPPPAEPGAGSANSEPAVSPPPLPPRPVASDARPGDTRSAARKPQGAGGAAAGGEASRTTKSAPPPAGPPAKTQPDSAAGRAATAPPGNRPSTPPPVIPDSDQPVRVQLAMTKTLFDTGGALFVDARDASDYEAGHIPGAVRLTRDDVFGEPERMKKLLERGKPIVTYCSGGECEASLDLARALVDVGYRKVLVFAGGFPEWTGAGYPVERGSAGR